jgi:hypothetical protein
MQMASHAVITSETSTERAQLHEVARHTKPL